MPTGSLGGRIPDCNPKAGYEKKPATLECSHLLGWFFFFFKTKVRKLSPYLPKKQRALEKAQEGNSWSLLVPCCGGGWHSIVVLHRAGRPHFSERENLTLGRASCYI